MLVSIAKRNAVTKKFKGSACASNVRNVLVFIEQYFVNDKQSVLNNLNNSNSRVQIFAQTAKW